MDLSATVCSELWAVGGQHAVDAVYAVDGGRRWMTRGSVQMTGSGAAPPLMHLHPLYHPPGLCCLPSDSSGGELF